MIKLKKKQDKTDDVPETVIDYDSLTMEELLAEFQLVQDSLGCYVPVSCDLKRENIISIIKCNKKRALLAADDLKNKYIKLLSRFDGKNLEMWKEEFLDFSVSLRAVPIKDLDLCGEVMEQIFEIMRVVSVMPNRTSETLNLLNALVQTFYNYTNFKQGYEKVAEKASVHIEFLIRCLDVRHLDMYTRACGLLTALFVLNVPEQVIDSFSKLGESDKRPRFECLYLPAKTDKKEANRLTHSLLVVNALFAQLESPEFRFHLRLELSQLEKQLQDIQKTTVFANDNRLNIQVNAYVETKRRDMEIINSRYSEALNVYDDPEIMIKLITLINKGTPECENLFLSILQHMMMIREEKFFRIAYLKVINHAVTQLVLHKNEQNPDPYFSTYTVDFSALTTGLASAEAAESFKKQLEETYGDLVAQKNKAAELKAKMNVTMKQNDIKMTNLKKEYEEKLAALQAEKDKVQKMYDERPVIEKVITKEVIAPAGGSSTSESAPPAPGGTVSTISTDKASESKPAAPKPVGEIVPSVSDKVTTAPPAASTPAPAQAVPPPTAAVPPPPSCGPAPPPPPGGAPPPPPPSGGSGAPPPPPPGGFPPPPPGGFPPPPPGGFPPPPPGGFPPPPPGGPPPPPGGPPPPPGGGPPPPGGFRPGGPPPPGGFKAPGGPRMKNGKKVIVTVVPTKRINWDVIGYNAATQVSTFWKDLDETKFESSDMLKMLSEKFSAKKTKDGAKDGAKKKPEKVVVLRVLEDKVANNMAIMLGSMKKSPDDVKDLIFRLDETFLTDSVIDGLLKNIPEDASWVATFKSFKSEYKDLHPAEQLLCKIAEIPNITERLRSCKVKLSLLEEINDIKKKVAFVLQGCVILRENKKFHTLLTLILMVGNFMNAGSRNECAAGFSILFLERLADVKTSDNKLNLLHVLADLVITNHADTIEGFQNELSALGLGQGITEKDAKAEIDKLAVQLKIIESTLEMVKKSKVEGDVFELSFSDFASNAATEIDICKEMLNEMASAYKNMCVFYALNPTKIEPNEVFTAICNFVTLYEKSVSENVLRKLSEAKAQAKKEAEEAKLAAKEAKMKAVAQAKESGEPAAASAGQDNMVMDDLLNKLMNGSAFVTPEKSAGNKKKKETTKKPKKAKTGDTDAAGSAAAETSVELNPDDI